MPRFYFHTHDGVDTIDTEGMELADWKAAKVQAVKYAAQMLHDDARRLQMDEHWWMDVTDGASLLLFRLDFQITATAAMLGQVKVEPNGQSTPDSRESD